MRFLREKAFKLRNKLVPQKFVSFIDHFEPVFLKNWKKETRFAIQKARQIHSQVGSILVQANVSLQHRA